MFERLLKYLHLIVDMDKPIHPILDESARMPIPAQPVSKPLEDPIWWRMGSIPCVVLVLVALAGDFLFPSTQGFGLGAAIGVLLGIAALLLLRRDFSRGEQYFLVALGLICFVGLLISGNIWCWLAAIVVPFFIVLMPGKHFTDTDGRYYTWWSFWVSQRARTELSVRFGRCRHFLPLMLSVFIGIVCFVFFLALFATGNPVVKIVWNTLFDAWNQVVDFLNLDLSFFWHVICWGIGVMWFGIYTFGRFAGKKAQPIAEVPTTPSQPMLPYLTPSVLIGSNLAFLVATSTDVTYLWLHRVPHGVSQTAYMYEGVASISWASFIAFAMLLVLFRRKGSARHSLMSKMAGYALLVQTFALAVSVYMRLYYQVDAYGFTLRRLLAAESMLVGIAGLTFLLFYMNRAPEQGCRWRSWGAIFMLLLLGLGCVPSQRLAAALNMRYASSHPQWHFSISDFNFRAFSVEKNLAFAYYVYKQNPDEDFRQRMLEACQRIQHRAERKTWRHFSLVSNHDEAVAAHIHALILLPQESPMPH